MYLSNSEREALGLVGFTDPEVYTVAERLARAKAKGTYVPGEESLRLRLAQAMGEIAANVEEALPNVVTEEETYTIAVTEETPPADALTTTAVSVGAPELAAEVVPEGEKRHGAMSDADFASMTKKQIVEFAHQRFGVQLDGAKLKDDLISEAQALMNQRLAVG